MLCRACKSHHNNRGNFIYFSYTIILDTIIQDTIIQVWNWLQKSKHYHWSAACLVRCLRVGKKLVRRWVAASSSVSRFQFLTRRLELGLLLSVGIWIISQVTVGSRNSVRWSQLQAFSRSQLQCFTLHRPQRRTQKSSNRVRTQKSWRGLRLYLNSCVYWRNLEATTDGNWNLEVRIWTQKSWRGMRLYL